MIQLRKEVDKDGFYTGPGMPEGRHSFREPVLSFYSSYPLTSEQIKIVIAEKVRRFQNGENSF